MEFRGKDLYGGNFWPSYFLRLASYTNGCIWLNLYK